LPPLRRVENDPDDDRIGGSDWNAMVDRIERLEKSS
jgi:hypothetical protein